LRHDRATIDNCRNLPHRVDGEILRLLLLALLEIHEDRFIWRADFLEHPVDNSTTRHRVVIEDDPLAHEALRSEGPKYSDGDGLADKGSTTIRRSIAVRSPIAQVTQEAHRCRGVSVLPRPNARGIIFQGASWLLAACMPCKEDARVKHASDVCVSYMTRSQAIVAWPQSDSRRDPTIQLTVLRRITASRP